MFPFLFRITRLNPSNMFTYSVILLYFSSIKFASTRWIWLNRFILISNHRALVELNILLQCSIPVLHCLFLFINCFCPCVISTKPKSESPPAQRWSTDIFGRSARTSTSYRTVRTNFQFTQIWLKASSLFCPLLTVYIFVPTATSIFTLPNIRLSKDPGFRSGNLTTSRNRRQSMLL